ncbi:MAG: Zn-ribbon domain-containing OB-fold protein [Dehalococcoidia bacterium]
MREAPAKPLPVPTPETEPFWEGLRRHELRIQRCQDCHKAYFYPRPFCPSCFSENVEWFVASGRAKLHTYTIPYRTHPSFQREAPFVLAVAELEEGPRMATNLVGVEPDPAKLPVDMPIEIVFDDVTDTITLPKFRPA